MNQKVIETVRMVDKVPYHFQLEHAVDAMLEAQHLGYPIDFNWVEIQRDNLSRVLDKLKAKA